MVAHVVHGASATPAPRRPREAADEMNLHHSFARTVMGIWWIDAFDIG